MSGSASALDELTPDELAQMEGMREADRTLPPLSPREPPSAEPPEPPAEPAPPADAAPPAEPDIRPQEPVQPGTEAQVPRQALEEERRQRKDYEQRLRDLERRYAADTATANERLRLLTEAAQAHIEQTRPKPEPERSPPDFATDPAGFVLYQAKELDRLREEVRNTRGVSDQLRQMQEAQAANNELQQWGLTQEKQFADTQPDYGQAIMHLRNARVALLQSMGWTDPRQIEQAIGNDVRQLATIAQRQGVNFGKMLYDMSVAHGYQRPNGAIPPSNGQNPPPAVPIRTPAGDSAVERLVRGAEMAQTVGATSGAPRGEPAPSAIAAMSDAEFEALYARLQKQGPAAVKSLFGS